MEQQLALLEVLPSMSYEEYEKIAINTLKRYRKLPGLIKAAERRVEGRGLRFPDDPTIPEYMRLSPHEQRLATVGRAYTYDMRELMHIQKAETLFHSITGINAEDEECLDEIRGMMIGATPWWSIDGALDNTRQYIIPKQKAEEEVKRLKDEMETIEEALSNLKSYAPHLYQLLYSRYIERKPVFNVIKELNISERTHDRWKKEAIAEFAMLAGIIAG